MRRSGAGTAEQGLTIVVAVLPLVIGFIIGAVVWTCRIAVAAFLIGFERAMQNESK